MSHVASHWKYRNATEKKTALCITIQKTIPNVIVIFVEAFIMS